MFDREFVEDVITFLYPYREYYNPELINKISEDYLNESEEEDMVLEDVEQIKILLNLYYSNLNREFINKLTFVGKRRKENNTMYILKLTVKIKSSNSEGVDFYNIYFSFNIYNENHNKENDFFVMFKNENPEKLSEKNKIIGKYLHDVGFDWVLFKKSISNEKEWLSKISKGSEKYTH